MFGRAPSFALSDNSHPSAPAKIPVIVAHHERQGPNISVMESIETGDAESACVRSRKAWDRAPKPDMAYQCRTLDDMLSAVQYETQTRCQALIPEETTCRLQFDLNSALEYAKIKDSGAAAAPAQLTSRATGAAIDPDPCPGYSIVAGLSNFYDEKEKLKYQRAVAKTMVEAAAHADGFAYVERRAVNTQKDDGYRFSYVCRDSMQNKHRAANKANAGDSSLVKPTFDCKGGMRITFSVKKLCVDVWYHHLPIHETVLELEQARKAQREYEAASAPQPPPPAPIQPASNASAFSWNNPFQGPSAVPEPQPAAANPTECDQEQPKKKRGRPTKSSNASAPTANSPSSSRDKRGIDTLVDVLSADINGATNGAHSSPSKPKAKKAKTQATAPTPAVASSSKEASTSTPTHEKHKRERTGCLTCRKRKIKCDKQRPTCATCSKKSLSCSWPPTVASRDKARQSVLKRLETAPWQSE